MRTRDASRLPFQDDPFSASFPINHVEYPDRSIGRTRRQPLSIVVELGIVLENARQPRPDLETWY